TSTCVECVIAPDCPSDRPICNDNACRACIADTECSDVCLPDGACADPARIVYAASGGGGSDCTSAAPCALDTALTHVTAATDIVKLAPGTYERTAPLEIGANLILAGTGAIVHGMQPSFGPLIDFASADVALVGLELDANMQPGVSCRMGTLRIHRARILSAPVAVAASPCMLVVERAAIAASTGTAISVSSGPVSITSSCIVANPNGGVALDMVSPGTIAGTTITGTTAASPVQCGTSPGVELASDIIYGNAA